MAIENPVNPSQQSTPSIELDKKNTANFGGSQTTNITINNTDNTNSGYDLANILELMTAIAENAATAPYDGELSPADARSGATGVAGEATAPSVGGVQLPAGMVVTFSPYSSGAYGEIVTDVSGKQSVTVYANIPDVDGIISYEVRLIKND